LASEQGLSIAQFNLGAKYLNGEGVPKNYTEAAKWYKKSSDQGLAEAQNNLGHLYENGLGLDKDLKKAYILYGKAARQGMTGAQFNLGRFYVFGLGTSGSQTNGALWWTIAALNKHHKSRVNLETLELLMTPEQLEKVTGKVSLCLKSEYKNC
jgi:TPR repeat protein